MTIKKNKLYKEVLFPWSLIKKYILQIQKRIYYAEQKKDQTHVYELQTILLHSWCFQSNTITTFFSGDISEDFKETQLLETYFPLLKSKFFSTQRSKKHNQHKKVRELVSDSFKMKLKTHIKLMQHKDYSLSSLNNVKKTINYISYGENKVKLLDKQPSINLNLLIDFSVSSRGCFF